MATRADFRRIGLPMPSSNTTQEPEFIRMPPDGVTLHVARLPLRNVEPNATIGIVEDIESEARKLPDADVVMLACGNWRTLGIVGALESAIGKPALTTNQVSLWAVRRLAGCTRPIPGCGMPMRHHMIEKVA